MHIHLAILLAVFSSVCSSCGSFQSNKKEKNSTAPQPKQPDTQEQPNTPEQLPQTNPPPKPEGQSEEENCKGLGERYQWVDGMCKKLPNVKVDGTLNAAPAIVWQASDETCDKHHNDDNGDYYTNCAGVDVTIPMPVIENTRTLNSVSVLFSCTAYEPIEPLTLELYIGKSFVAKTLAPSTDPVRVEAISEPGELSDIKIKLAPTSADSSFGPVVFRLCKIELLENSVKAYEAPLAEFDFSFSGNDTEGNSCGTGTKRFETLAEVCVALQSKLKNRNNCALDDRLTRFNEQCDPNGYSFFESRTCEVALYPKDIDLTNGPLPNENRLAQGKYCVGRKSDGIDTSSVSLNGVLFSSHARLSVLMTFVPKSDRSENTTEISRFQILKGDESGTLTDEIDLSGNLFSQKFGKTNDGQFQYSIACGTAPSCDTGEY